MATVIFVWNEPGYRYVFQSWPGPVGRHVDSIADRSVDIARTLIGKKFAWRTGTHKRSGTGRLAASLRSNQHHHRDGDLEAHVGANPSGSRRGYAWFHHEGARSHIIRPRRANLLVFPVSPSGPVIYTARVRHPGNTGQKYLTRAVEAALASS